jgi:antitoxin component YwqK of YwqJK toxin-antitoxin module
LSAGGVVMKNKKLTNMLKVNLRLIFFLLIFAGFVCNKGQNEKNSMSVMDTLGNNSNEFKNFKVCVTENYDDGKLKSQIDTTTGYRKYYYENGKLEMVGKVTNNYRNGLWHYYSDSGLLMKEETSNEKGKLTSKTFQYFRNNKIMNETYIYFEGDYKDTTNFKLHRIEKMFYDNGQLCSEVHVVNKKIVELKCWDPQGNEKPKEYLDGVKSFHVDN